MKRAALLFLGATACADFDRVDRNICGNAIVEPGRQEDCDGAPIHAGAEVYACGEQGTVTQCRLLCNAEDRACPDGFACSREDGICRQPLERQYEEATARTLERLGRIGTVDLDGDRRTDLLTIADERNDGTGRFAGYHFDPAGLLDGEPEHDALPTLLRSPIVAGSLGEVAAEGVANVSVITAPSLGPGLSALRGRPDRTLLPGLSAHFTRFGPLGSDLQLIPTVKNSPSGTYGFGAALGPQASGFITNAVYDVLVSAIIETPIWFRIEPQLDGAFPTRHIAVGPIASIDYPGVESVIMTVPGEGFARLYDITESHNDISAQWAYQPIALPAGVTVPEDGGAWLGDANGDGFLDLWLSGGAHTYLAYGFGGHAFASSLALDAPDNRVAPDPVILGAHPLAVGRIDDDPYADIVFPEEHAIAVSHPDLAFSEIPSIACPPFGTALVSTYACSLHGGNDIESVNPDTAPRWSAAIIEDINRDDRPDVVAALRDTNTIDIRIGAEIGTGTFVGFYSRPLVTPGRVKLLGLSEHNGDAVPDVIFVARAEDDSHDQVFVSLGRLEGGPQSPQVLFEAPEVLSMAANGDSNADFTWRNERGETFVSMTVASAGSEDLLTRSTARFGCPRRYYDPPVRPPQQLALGRFDAHEGLDAALVYVDCFGALDPLEHPEETHRLVLFPAGKLGTTSAVLDRPWIVGACAGTHESFLNCEQTRDALRPVGVDLELTVPWSTDALIVALDVLPSDGLERDELVLLGGGQVLVAALDPDPPRLPRFSIVQRSTLDVSAGGSYEGWRGKAETTDVDGDGDLDIVLLTSDERLVYLETRDGRIVPGARSLGFSSAPGGALRSFAICDADYDLVRDDLVIAAGADIFLVRDAYSGSASPLPIEIAGGSQTGDIDEILAADFTGDGLLDLAVARGDSVALLRSLPANP